MLDTISRMNWLKNLAAVTFLGSAVAHSASFDCSKAQTKVEHFVCAERELSKLDEVLAEVYTDALGIENKAAVVREQQKQWLKIRNSCVDAACIREQYRARISELVDIAQADIPMGSRSRMTARVLTQPDLGLDAGWDFVLHPGAGVDDWLENADDPMCNKVKDYMNTVARRWDRGPDALPFNRCVGSVRLAPFFLEPPWTELDPKMHEELIVRLLWFRQDPEGYFKVRPQRLGYDESHFRRKARDFVSSGGRLQHWRARVVEVLYFPPDGNNKPSPGEQDVIQLRYPTDVVTANRKPADCARPNWRGEVFLVTRDLTGPLRNLDEMSNLYLYEGDPVLISTTYEISIRSPHHSPAHHSCRLTYPNHTSKDIEDGK